MEENHHNNHNRFGSLISSHLDHVNSDIASSSYSPFFLIQNLIECPQKNTNFEDRLGDTPRSFSSLKKDGWKRINNPPMGDDTFVWEPDGRGVV